MHRAALLATSALVWASANIGHAQDSATHYSLFGTPGLLEMPTAQNVPEGAFATTLSYQEGLTRATATFQFSPRFSASARYSFVDLYADPTTDIDKAEFERSFDLHYRLNDETTYLPAIAIGMRDIFTPGRFSSEFVVASKSIGDSLVVTAGVGWGAMGQRESFENPLSDLAERPVFDDAKPEGQFGSDYWFRGDAAAFGGLSYQINDRWGLVAEYSSIAYPEEEKRPALASQDLE